MTSPFFSIIIPIYNVEAYLRECVESILAQDFEDYELLLIDDGSTDNCPAICDQYMENSGKIRAIHKTNGGSSDARNVGIRQACGAYVICIDSDDYVLLTCFLRDIYERAQRDRSDLILYKFRKLNDETGALAPCGFSMKEAEIISDPDELLGNLVRADAYYGAAWVKAIRRQILVDNGIEFEKGLLGEDMDWYFHLLIHVRSITAIDKSYIAYRQRAGSVSKSNGIKNLTDYVYVMEKWSTGIEEAAIAPARKEALRGALAKYYSNLLITYSRTEDATKCESKDTIEHMSYLLNHAKSKRPMIVKKFYSLLGFNGTVSLLAFLDRVRR